MAATDKVDGDGGGGCDCSGSAVFVIIIKFLLFLSNFLVWVSQLLPRKTVQKEVT